MTELIIDKQQGWKNILKIIIPYSIIVGSCQLIGGYFSGYNYAKMNTIPKTSIQALIAAFSTVVGTFVVIWLFRKYVDKKTFKSLGFADIAVKKDTFMGFLFGFIIILLGFSTLIITKQIAFQNIQFSPVDLILSFGTFILVAVSEELLVRGYILNNLMMTQNKYVALIISSLIFSLLHSGNHFITPLSIFTLFIAGLFLGLTYIYTKSLWFPIALHFSWNFFQGAIFGFNVSGFDHYSLIKISYKTSNIWNGGGFGFEGSILSIIFQLIAIVLIYFLFKDRVPNDHLLKELQQKSN